MRRASSAFLFRFVFMRSPLAISSIAPFFIHNVQQGQTSHIAADVFSEQCLHAVITTFRMGRCVTSNQNIWSAPERVVGGQRLAIDDIKARAGNPFFFESV
jgi:hypothetical protein